MANQFKIMIFNEEDPQAQYNAITPDADTLYILTNGKMYFGEIPMECACKEGVGIISSQQSINNGFNTGQLYAIVQDGLSYEKGLYYASSNNTLEPVTDTTVNIQFDEESFHYVINNTSMVVHSGAVSRDFVGHDDTLMTSKAVVDYVKAMLENYVTFSYNNGDGSISSSTTTDKNGEQGSIGIVDPVRYDTDIQS